MAAQERWGEHAAFMNGLVAAGFVVLGGPVADGETILLIVNAKNPKSVQERLAADPWTSMRLLTVTRIEPWQIQLGEPSIS